MKNKGKIAACMVSVMLCMGMFSTTAFAQSNEPVEETVEVTETVIEEPVEPVPLTPEGNLTLVDDVDGKASEDKQFITVVTKSGNYFYLVIDRAKEGENTVHFLNLVDESDLLSLMEEEEAAKYQPSTPESTVEPETEVPSTTEEPVKEEATNKSGNMLPVLLLLVALLGGGGFFAYTKLLKKKKSEQNQIDPDADYREEDDMDYDESEDVEGTDEPDEPEPEAEEDEPDIDEDEEFPDEDI